MWMRMGGVLACVGVLALAGCGGGAPANVGPGGVRVHDDPFAQHVQYIGPEERVNAGGWNTRYNLRSFRSRQTGQVEHQIYVTDRYRGSGWRFWRRASAANGAELPFVRINTEVDGCENPAGCRHTEIFGVSFPTQWLHQAPNGFAVKAYSQNGHEVVLTITAAQVQAQLAALGQGTAGG